MALALESCLKITEKIEGSKEDATCATEISLEGERGREREEKAQITQNTREVTQVFFQINKIII